MVWTRTRDSSTAPARIANREALEEALSAGFATKPRTEWEQLLLKWDVPGGPVNNIGEALADPQVQLRDMVVEIDHPVAGSYRTAGNPIKSGTSDAFAPPPTLGQDTDAVLTGLLGYGDGEIAALRESWGSLANGGKPDEMGRLPEKRILIIAGPNGAGKTTLARELLPNEANILTFINADLIAAGLNPLRPELAAFQAGRMMLEMIDACVQRGESFAFETTLSGRGYARMIPRWREEGYWVTLVYLRVSSPEAVIDRVRQRVLEGGHDVPEDVIRRRFYSSQHNFEHIYRRLVNEAIIYDI